MSLCDRRWLILCFGLFACDDATPPPAGSRAAGSAGLDQLPVATGCFSELLALRDARPPVLLADTGCVRADDPRVPIDGFVPYDINLPFWTDGAIKQRYLALPPGKQIVVLANGDWDLPVGTVVQKTFMLGTRMVETRFLVRRAEQPNWLAFTYEWNEQQTAAILAEKNRALKVGEQTWQVPAEVCETCHTADANFSLGIETAQMNRDFTYEATGRRANQVTTLAELGVLAGLPDRTPDALPRFPDPNAADVPLEERARAYLHVNCSHCHRPSNHCPLTDLRYQTSFEMTRLCNQTEFTMKLGRDLGVEGARPIVAGQPERSLVLLRMKSPPGPFRMPMWGSLVVHDQGVALLTEWVNSLNECPELPLPANDPHLHQNQRCPQGSPHCPI